jgi:ABC-type multidrug transport system ATPase subunit
MTVKKVHFVIEKGTIFSLLGPNASGKSTIYNIITMDLSKTLGKVSYFGTEINNLNSNDSKKVGICPQFDYLYDNLTTIQHL